MQSRTTDQTHGARGIHAWYGSWGQFPRSAFWGGLDLVSWGQAQIMHAMQKLIHTKGKHNFAISLLTLISCAWVSLSLSLFLSLLALTTHLPLKQGKKLKTHSATLVVGRPAEANFAPREVWISILSYWHCNKVKCIEMISSHTHTHTGHCLLNFLQAKLHWRSWQWQGCRIVPQSMVDLRKLVQFHRWLVT